MSGNNLHPRVANFLSRNTSSIERQLEEAKDEVGKLSAEKEELKASLADLPGAIKAAHEKIEEQTEQIKVLESERNEFKAQSETHAAKVTDLTSALENATKTISDKDEAIAKLTSEISLLQQKQEVAAKENAPGKTKDEGKKK